MKNNLSYTDLYLTSAGFTIRIRFHPKINNYEKSDFTNNLYNNITNYFGKLIKKSAGDADYSIEVIRHPVKVFHKANNGSLNHFIHYYIEKNNEIITFHHLSFEQFLLLIIQSLQILLSRQNGFLLHASGVVYKKTVLIFTGKSTAGKSTVIKLLIDKFKPVADDSIIIKKEKNTYYAYQTPIKDKGNWISKSAKRYKIGGVFFLKKQSYFRISKVNDKNLIIKLLAKQLWSNKILLNKQIKELLNFINTYDSFYQLAFLKDKEGLVSLMGKYIKDYSNNLSKYFHLEEYNQRYSSTHKVNTLLKVNRLYHKN